MALIAAAMLLVVAIPLFGAAANVPGVAGDSPANPLQPLIDGLLGKYGWLTTVILVIGSLRLLFKPIMLALENYVHQTPGTSDDDRLARFEASPVYKVIEFILDVGASIKLPLVAPRSKNDPE